MQQRELHPPSEPFAPGTAIEVRDHFCELWCSGFEVAGATDRGYIVRRVADNYVLPLPFAVQEVRQLS